MAMINGIRMPELQYSVIFALYVVLVHSVLRQRCPPDSVQSKSLPCGHFWLALLDGGTCTHLEV
jgi:hypothetical protein